MRRRRASILLLAGLFVAIPAPALATIEGISPPSGTVEQGKSTSATVTVSSSQESCLQASASHPTITVDFPGSFDPCDSDMWSVTMTVSTTALTPTGSYTVTVKEVRELLGILGISLGLITVDSRTWNLTVTPPPTPTTATTTTTTLTTIPTIPTIPTITTSPTTTTTTTNPTTTTTTTGPSTNSSERSTGGGSTSSATGSPTGGEATNTTSGTGGSGTSRDTSRPTPTTISIPELASPEFRLGVPRTESAQAPISAALSRILSPRLPPPLVDAVLSPLIVLEVVVSAMAQSASALVAPLTALLVCALWLFRDTLARLLRFNRRALAADTSGQHPPPWTP